MSHTPGPWTLNGPCQFADPSTGAMVYAEKGEHGNGHLVATIKYEYSDSQKDNAELIAASPDLLEACLTTRVAIGFAINEPCIHPEVRTMLHKALSECRAAIKKARGEQ